MCSYIINPHRDYNHAHIFRTTLFLKGSFELIEIDVNYPPCPLGIKVRNQFGRTELTISTCNPVFSVFSILHRLTPHDFTRQGRGPRLKGLHHGISYKHIVGWAFCITNTFGGMH